MQIIIRKYNETYVRITTDDVTKDAIYNYFAFKPQNYQFNPRYKSGGWDGKIRFYQKIKNLFPIGLLFKLDAWLKARECRVEYKDFDKSNTIFTEDQINKYAEHVNFPHKLRDYQLESIQIALQERKCVIKSPTATGKSAIIYFIHRLCQEKNDIKVLIIVPTISLVDQMLGDFIDYSDVSYQDRCQLIFSGQNKKIEKPVTISTWQSLQKLPKEFFQQFGMILVDECHGGANDGKVVKKIVEYCSRAKYKIGLTGTLADGKLNEFSVNAIYGKVYQYTNTRREIKRGNLTPVKITQINLKYNINICREFHKQRIKEKQLAALADKKVGASLYHHEIQFTNELEYRKNLITKISRKQQNNILILYRRNKFGYSLLEKLKTIDNRQVFFINGATPKEDREEVRKVCEKYSDAIILANYKVFSTGVNIKNLHHIIFSESCKSKITVLQSIGRGLRLHKTKDILNIFDIVDVLKYKNVENIMMKHAVERESIYKIEGFEYKTIIANSENFE